MLPSLAPAETEKNTNPASPDSSTRNASDATASAAGSLSQHNAAATIQRPIDFVNLYDVLQMTPGSAPTDLRKRITEMYLDAQKNQDHRNPQKKVYYQQLYEIYLPQARHLLLDTKRRAEYDQYLEVYREDQERSAQVEEVMAAQENGGAPQNPQATQVTTKAIEELMTPEELAAYRSDLWRQWEEGLERSKGELARLTFSPIELQQRAVDRQHYMERVMIEVREENRKMEEKRERERRREQEAREAEQAKAREEEFKRRREQQFEENIGDLTATAKMYGAAGACVGSLLFCFSLIYVINAYLWMRPSRDTFNIAAIGLSIVASAFAAWRGGAWGSQRVKDRSVSRKDVQGEAESIARRLMNERKTQVGNPKPSPNQLRQEAEELHEEINKQARQLHRVAYDEITAETAAYGRTFLISDGALAVGFGILYAIDMMLTSDHDLALRPTVAIFIWLVTIAVTAGLGFWNLQRVRSKTLDMLHKK